MQIIINVPGAFGTDVNDKFQDFFERLKEETRTHINNDTELLCGTYELETIEMFLDAFKEMRVIPDNATNGDVLKMSFPSIGFQEMAYTVHAVEDVSIVGGAEGKISYDFWKYWWNSPYKNEVVKMSEPPTQKQKDFAKVIEKVTGAPAPDTETKQAYSLYISKNINNYRRVKKWERDVEYYNWENEFLNG
jgi:hypothetical protein